MVTSKRLKVWFLKAIGLCRIVSFTDQDVHSSGFQIISKDHGLNPKFGFTK